MGHEPTWSSRQAIANLLGNIRQHPDKKVEGWYKGGQILVSSIGYELYFNGQRVGHEPSWTYEQAIANLQGNVESHPAGSGYEVVGLYNGSILT